MGPYPISCRKRHGRIPKKLGRSYGGGMEITVIIINLDVMMAKRKMSLNEVSARVGITLANLSILKNNKAKAIRFSTLDAICRALDCKIEDILEYVDEEVSL
jgi:putative transcriptional regulator